MNDLFASTFNSAAFSFAYEAIPSTIFIEGSLGEGTDDGGVDPATDTVEEDSLMSKSRSRVYKSNLKKYVTLGILYKKKFHLKRVQQTSSERCSSTNIQVKVFAESVAGTVGIDIQYPSVKELM